MADSKLRKDEENFDIEIKRWENETLEIRVWMIRIGKEYWFFAREIVSELGYVDSRRIVQRRIEGKKSMEELLGPNYKEILERSLESTVDKTFFVDFFRRVRSNQKLFNESTLYSFCATSKKEKAKPFREWVFNTIKEIRETGTYTLPSGPVDNPLDLLAKVSTFEKEIKTLREEIHTLKSKKVRAYKKRTKILRNTEIIRDYLKELKQEIERIENELEKSLEEITSSDSSSCYSNDSD